MFKGEYFIPAKPASAWLLPILKDVWNYSENKKGSGTNGRNIIRQGAIHVNGYAVTLEEVIDFPVLSVVIYPKSKTRKITIF